ncbi:uncharacterized protein [Prorops nasuta]|uniref:uncharacterized protein n=1 Tax=Prorops nasuta TaxID=863751 RepID=UPI0034CDB39A
MPDKTFKSHFRMSRTSFEALINMAGHINSRLPVSTVGFPEISLEKEFLIMIWYLANLESLRSVSERFGIAKSTCWDALHRTCHILVKINKTYEIIKWSNEERQLRISEGYRRRNFTGVIGCIDGSHILIKRPKSNGNSYVNRKGNAYLLLQGICDHQMVFTDIYAGEAGSLHDYTLYKRSDIYKSIKNGQAIFFRESYLLGDLAYKLSTNLMVGFKDNGYLTNRQKKFNKELSKIRVKIENAFGLLKGRFRRLIFLETRRLDLCVLLILSACILHNICIVNNEDLDVLYCHRENEVGNTSYIDSSDEEEENEHEVRNRAIMKRNVIMENF